MGIYAIWLRFMTGHGVATMQPPLKSHVLLLGFDDLITVFPDFFFSGAFLRYGYLTRKNMAQWAQSAHWETTLGWQLGISHRVWQPGTPHLLKTPCLLLGLRIFVRWRSRWPWRCRRSVRVADQWLLENWSWRCPFWVIRAAPKCQKTSISVVKHIETHGDLVIRGSSTLKPVIYILRNQRLRMETHPNNRRVFPGW